MKKAILLLLEDDPALHEILTEFLEEADFAVLGALNAEEARDLIYENPCDLLLLDVKVPGQSGFDLLSDLRKSGVSTPAIFLTSLNEVSDLSRGFEVGEKWGQATFLYSKELLLHHENTNPHPLAYVKILNFARMSVRA